MGELGFRWSRFSVSDRAAPTERQFEQLVEWLDFERDRETDLVLYLHCEGALGRSPTVAAAPPMRQGLSLVEAFRMVKAARPEVALADEQRWWLDQIAQPATQRQRS